MYEKCLKMNKTSVEIFENVQKVMNFRNTDSSRAIISD